MRHLSSQFNLLITANHRHKYQHWTAMTELLYAVSLTSVSPNPRFGHFKAKSICWCAETHKNHCGSQTTLKSFDDGLKFIRSESVYGTKCVVTLHYQQPVIEDKYEIWNRVQRYFQISPVQSSVLHPCGFLKGLPRHAQRCIILCVSVQ